MAALSFRAFYKLALFVLILGLIDAFPHARCISSRDLALFDTKKGYQFGDISRFLAKQASGKINEITGKSSYEFGDLTRWLDKQAKGKFQNLTGKENYQFGDLTSWAISSFTGKEAGSYEFGDITRELIRRVQSGEYELKDVYLALRVLMSAGASMTPIAAALPVNWLLQLINLGLAQDIAGRMVQVLASSLDERMKQALTGDPKYQLGDMTKRNLEKAVLNFTGNDTYSFGDISRKITSMAKEPDRAGANVMSIELSSESTRELEEWDEKLMQQST